MLLVSASSGNTAERWPLSLLGCRFMGRNRAAVSALVTTPAAPLSPLSFRAQQCSFSWAPQRGLCPGLSPYVTPRLQQRCGRLGLKLLPAGQRRVCARVLRAERCAGCSRARCGGAEHQRGVWAPGSAASASLGLGQKSDLTPSLLLVLHSSVGVASSCCFVVSCTAWEQVVSQTYFLSARKSLRVQSDKLFWLQKTQTWRGYNPQPVFSFLSPASAGGYLLSAWLATL